MATTAALPSYTPATDTAEVPVADGVQHFWATDWSGAQYGLLIRLPLPDADPYLWVAGTGTDGGNVLETLPDGTRVLYDGLTAEQIVALASRDRRRADAAEARADAAEARLAALRAVRP